MIDVSRIRNGDRVRVLLSPWSRGATSRRARICSWRANVPMLGSRGTEVKKDLVTVRVDDTLEYLVLSAADLYLDPAT